MVLIIASLYSRAQVDTINTKTLKLNNAAFRAGTASYAVYFEDSAGNRTSSADIWDRTIQWSTTPEGQKTYRFGWKWYRKDSLLASVSATGLLPSFQPLTHEAEYTGGRVLSLVFNDNLVTVPEAKQRTAHDSSFKVVLNAPAFEFPMDLELFALLPFKKVGQQFAMAFYEPGRPEAKYYPLAVTGKADLPLPGGQRVACWLLRIDYAPGSFATFWISDKTREVLKMQEVYKGIRRYKVKMY